MNQMNQVLIEDSQNLERLIRDAESRKKTSFLILLKSLPYRVWLVLIREVSLMICLVENYEKIPQRTPSKLIAGLFVRSLKLKSLLYNLEKRLRRRIY